MSKSVRTSWSSWTCKCGASYFGGNPVCDTCHEQKPDFAPVLGGMTGPEIFKDLDARHAFIDNLSLRLLAGGAGLEGNIEHLLLNEPQTIMNMARELLAFRATSGVKR